jgi:hypothetical protein
LGFLVVRLFGVTRFWISGESGDHEGAVYCKQRKLGIWEYGDMGKMEAGR